MKFAFQEIFQIPFAPFPVVVLKCKGYNFSFAMLLSFCVICKLLPRRRGKSRYGLPWIV